MAKTQKHLEAYYAKRGRRMLKRARTKFATAHDVLDAFLILCRDPCWQLRSSSTRTYKASIIQVLKEEVENGRLDPQLAAEGIAEIARLLAQRRGRPAPRTSAKKLIDVREEEIRLVSEHLRLKADKDMLDATLRLVIELMCRLGIRPSELARARLVGRTLLVLNAKHSHGRAPGPVRRISLERMPELLLKATDALLFRAKILIAQYGSWERVQKILAERLARTCCRVGVARICLYALRHAAIATWKRAGLQPAEIAALAGHISIKTAWRHYAGANSGWRPSFVCVEPDKRVVARIVSHMNSARRDWLPPPWSPPANWSEQPSLAVSH